MIIVVAQKTFSLDGKVFLDFEVPLRLSPPNYRTLQMFDIFFSTSSSFRPIEIQSDELRIHKEADSHHKEPCVTIGENVPHNKGKRTSSGTLFEHHVKKTWCDRGGVYTTI
jgi:hypothetical protein